jgi:hypothetical protein
MAIEAPLSRYKRTNFIIYVVACLGLAAWFTYDGYFNEEFRQKYTDEEGNPKVELTINRVAPPFLVAAAVALGVYYYRIQSRRLVADETELVIAGKEHIPYDAIEKIDKTYFDQKGHFTITYKQGDGSEAQKRLSDRDYDNLGAILDRLVAKIT